MTIKINIISLILLLSFLSGFSQKGEAQINKSEKLEKIIFLKKELNKKIQNLKIQIYNGNRDQAEMIKEEYVKLFDDSTATMIYETPNYKVWIGNFFTRLEADKSLLKIRKKYNNLLFIMLINILNIRISKSFVRLQNVFPIREH